MMTWSELLHRLVLVQGTTRLCAVRDLDELDIVGRIMRKENYLIGMLNAGVLGLYVKGLGPFGGRRFMLTKTLEWNLYLCILDPMFDEHFHVKQVRLVWCLLTECARIRSCGAFPSKAAQASARNQLGRVALALMTTVILPVLAETCSWLPVGAGVPV